MVYKYVFTHLENKYVKKVLNLSKQGLSFVPGAVHLMSRLEEAYGGQDITFEDSVVDAAGDGPGGIEYTAVEEQAMLMPYKGTFDDFNDRVVQFGYLVLFAPAFPLAPLLAFINNVIEIRSAGYKMAKVRSAATISRSRCCSPLYPALQGTPPLGTQIKSTRI
eukprot:SAG11_NODE_642_length_8006_cov_6.996965_3_plen_163_part_00